MIVVGGGSSARFGSNKLLAPVSGRPLITHTIDAIVGHVDVCVVVCGPETAAEVARAHPDVVVTAGGSTRTLSEMAGLAAVGGDVAVIGIHDAARPAVSGQLIEQLFTVAEEHGGAVPVVDTDRIILDKRTHMPVTGLKLAQTPQVFRGPELMAAYVRAAETGLDAFDTAEVMHHFGGVTIVGVRGDRSNVKVTFPRDLDAVARAITDPSRT